MAADVDIQTEQGYTVQHIAESGLMDSATVDRAGIPLGGEGTGPSQLPHRNQAVMVCNMSHRLICEATADAEADQLEQAEPLVYEPTFDPGWFEQAEPLGNTPLCFDGTPVFPPDGIGF